MDAEVTPEHADSRELGSLLAAIFERYHYDFREYAAASLARRVALALAHFGDRSPSELRGRVLADREAFTELLRFLTVQVSDLFRDPGYYRAVREQVVPVLRTYPSLKLWVAGCATGEEAYSLAIVLHEEGLLERSQIYATDIHPESLRVAEEGVYALDRFPRFSENYLAAGGRASLADYYVARYSSAVLDRSLKKSILFADHSLATDSVFAEMQFVSCRNVLIYFGRTLQDRAISLLHDSLCRRGFLGLGCKESLHFSRHRGQFDDFVPEARIYQRC